MNIKTSLGQQLKRWPYIYCQAERIYSTWKLLKYATFGTKLTENEWAERHLRKGNDWNDTRHLGENDEWVLGYWESRDHSHRPFLIEKISAFYPFSNILEIGCNCGPNLYLLAKKFPSIEITGIDINPRAIQEGNKFFAAEGISNVKLVVGKANQLEQFKDKSFDIVFTDAVLMYVGPDKIRKVTREMLRIAHKALILVEQQSFDSTARPNPRWFRTHYSDRWLRDYVSLLKQFVPERQIRVTKIAEDIWPDPVWQEVGSIIEVVI